MKLPSDPFILLSYVNTKLRDDFDSLDDLCASLGVEKDALITKLRDAGFTYVPEINQFN